MCVCTPHRISNFMAVSSGLGRSAATAAASRRFRGPGRPAVCVVLDCPAAASVLSRGTKFSAVKLVSAVVRCRCVPVSIRGTQGLVRLVQSGPGHVTPTSMAQVQRLLAGHACVCVNSWHNFHFFLLQTTCYYATCYKATYCMLLTHLRAVCYRKGARDNSVCVRAAGAVGGATHTTRKSSCVAVAANTGTSTYNTKDHTKYISTNIHLLKICTVRRSTQSKYSWCRCACVCVCSRVWQRLSCIANGRRCACARARAVVREFAGGAGAVRRVPRPPPEKFMHGTPARTPGADRHSVCVCACACVCTIYALRIDTPHAKKTKLLIQWCANVVGVSALRTVSVAVGARRMGP